MAPYQNLIVSRRDRTLTVKKMLAAIERMQEIMLDPLVASQRGYAFSDDDTDQLQRGKAALEAMIDHPATHQDRVLNEQRLAEGGKGVEMAVMLLRRDGFDAVRSAGDQTFDDGAFNDADVRQMDRALTRFDRITGYTRN